MPTRPGRASGRAGSRCRTASGWSSEGRSVRPRASSAFCEATARTSRPVATPARRRGSCEVLCLIAPMRRHSTSAPATTRSDHQQQDEPVDPRRTARRRAERRGRVAGVAEHAEAGLPAAARLRRLRTARRRRVPASRRIAAMTPTAAMRMSPRLTRSSSTPCPRGFMPRRR